MGLAVIMLDLARGFGLVDAMLGLGVEFEFTGVVEAVEWRMEPVRLSRSWMCGPAMAMVCDAPRNMCVYG